MEDYKLIGGHTKPQQANQFRNVHLICIRSSKRIIMHYIDLDSARKSEQDAKEIMKFCPELREIRNFLFSFTRVSAPISAAFLYAMNTAPLRVYST